MIRAPSLYSAASVVVCLVLVFVQGTLLPAQTKNQSKAATKERSKTTKELTEEVSQLRERIESLEAEIKALRAEIRGASRKNGSADAPQSDVETTVQFRDVAKIAKAASKGVPGLVESKSLKATGGSSFWVVTFDTSPILVGIDPKKMSVDGIAGAKLIGWEHSSAEEADTFHVGVSVGRSEIQATATFLHVLLEVPNKSNPSDLSKDDWEKSCLPIARSLMSK